MSFQAYATSGLLGATMMKAADLLDRNERIRWALSSAWETCIHRIAAGRIRINKESSLQLHYAYILAQFGELACIEKAESFEMELETHHAGKSIDIWCSLNDVEAAIELKCFRTRSNRATDIDMYDVLNDISRLESYTHVSQRRFICLTDNEYYSKASHAGHAGSVSIGEGKTYRKQMPIVPSWAGKWKDTSRDKGLTFTNDIEFNWNVINGWYFLFMEVESRPTTASI